MAAAITADFAALPDVEVWTMRDNRLPPRHDARCRVELIESAEDELSNFTKLAAVADWTLLIVPEQGGILHERSRWVLESGGRLLSPGPEVVRLSERQAANRRASGAPAFGCRVDAFFILASSRLATCSR